MTYPPTWGHSQPHSGPSPRSTNDGHRPPDAHGLGLMIGELIGQGRHVLWHLNMIDGQIKAIRETQEDQRETQEEHDRRLREIERRNAKDAADPIPKWEQVAKRHAVWIVPAGALTATGSWELALKLLSALK